MFCEQLNFVLRCLSWWTIAFEIFLPSMTQSELFLMKLCKIYPFEWARAPARKRRRMNDELANNLLMNLAWLGTSSSNRRKRRNEWMSGSAKKSFTESDFTENRIHKKRQFLIFWRIFSKSRGAVAQSVECPSKGLRSVQLYWQFESQPQLKVVGKKS